MKKKKTRRLKIFITLSVGVVVFFFFRLHIISFVHRYAEGFRRLMGEITTAAQTSRVNRKRLVDAFSEKLRRLIDDAVDESRKSVKNLTAYDNTLFKRYIFFKGVGRIRKEEFIVCLPT